MRNRGNESGRADANATGTTRTARHGHHPRWGRIAVVAVASAGAAWATGRETARRIENQDIETAAQRQPPSPGFPRQAPNVDLNNALMRMGLVANLDGTAIAYIGEADGLVIDGQFRTDLTLVELAHILRVDLASIASRMAPDEVDPDAELFRAQIGTLTEESKERSRKIRREQARAGKTPDAVFADFENTNLSFTFNRLRNPNAQEKIVLTAIARAAVGIMPKPGDLIRAVGASRSELAPGRIALAAGMLPVEAPR
jgi:hypothetical protein